MKRTLIIENGEVWFNGERLVSGKDEKKICSSINKLFRSVNAGWEK